MTNAVWHFLSQWLGGVVFALVSMESERQPRGAVTDMADRDGACDSRGHRQTRRTEPRISSAEFIVGNHYGTCASTSIRSHDGCAEWHHGGYGYDSFW